MSALLTLTVCLKVSEEYVCFAGPDNVFEGELTGPPIYTYTVCGVMGIFYLSVLSGLPGKFCLCVGPAQFCYDW